MFSVWFQNLSCMCKYTNRYIFMLDALFFPNYTSVYGTRHFCRTSLQCAMSTIPVSAPDLPFVCSRQHLKPPHIYLIQLLKNTLLLLRRFSQQCCNPPDSSTLISFISVGSLCYSKYFSFIFFLSQFNPIFLLLIGQLSTRSFSKARCESYRMEFVGFDEK